MVSALYIFTTKLNAFNVTVTIEKTSPWASYRETDSKSLIQKKKKIYLSENRTTLFNIISSSFSVFGPRN